MLKLFVSGMSLSSARAIENLKKICDEHMPENSEVEIIDINTRPGDVKKYDVFACPTLLKKSPIPLKRIIGDLSDSNKVLTALGITIEK